jgi:hypothetical protein
MVALSYLFMMYAPVRLKVYPEQIWQVWMKQYTYTTASGFVMRWVTVPKETIIHERPPGMADRRGCHAELGCGRRA